jgi:hypothetical protein
VSRNLETSSASNHLDITNRSSNCSSNIVSSLAPYEKNIIEKREKGVKEERLKAIRTRIEKTKGRKNNERDSKTTTPLGAYCCSHVYCLNLQT